MKVTDEMLQVARSMKSFESMIERIIELHEQSKPKPEPFGYFRPDAFSWTSCEKEDDGAVALYELKDVS